MIGFLVIFRCFFLCCAAAIIVVMFRLDTASAVRNGEARVVGGSPIGIAEIPYICSVRERMPAGHWGWTRAHICGSTILNDHWLLTSAHCVYGKDIASLLIVCGVRQVRLVKRIELNPGFVGGAKGNDLALIMLKKSVVFTGNVQPIPIYDQSNLLTNSATIVGYGSSAYREGEWTANGLQAATVPILTHEECRKQVSELAAYLTPDILCTGKGLTAAGTCIGDSGGPVTIATDLQPFNLLAVPAWTVAPCGSVPSMHTLVSVHIQWILNVISPILA
ncbi:trypsin-1-like [Toxorhynchites rutilus septentrionalis]|uniref:trypsin-1-like n=1 Tax=Toxorhynchites rutilus septentrionalis TaxID=329112 RepID=UPI002478EBB7|nr:trypsin-1-like [Toxorhynchites rutilus septentrionalis]